jgi:hypothetical protein
MNLQLLRYGIGTRAASKAAGYLLAVWMLGAGLGAWAQVATRTHVSVASEARGTTFTVKVGDIAGTPASGGTVSFETAKGSLGSAFVKDGAAELTVDKLPQGIRTVTAAYSGSEGYAASSSRMSMNADTGTLPDFALTASPTAASVSPGDFANITVTVTPENGFNDTVTLSCSGVPATAKCVFSPTTITPLADQPVTATLQIQTQAPSALGNSMIRPASTAAHVAYAIVLPGVLVMAGLGALRRRSGLATLRVLGFVALLAAGGLGLAGCSQRYGYLNHPPSGNPGTAPGTYMITVSGYATLSGTSVVGHTLNVTLTVK